MRLRRSADARRSMSWSDASRVQVRSYLVPDTRVLSRRPTLALGAIGVGMLRWRLACSLRALIPGPLRRWLHAPMDLASGAVLSAPLLARRPRRPPPVRIFYGHRQLPGRQAYAHGGLVKFQNLQDRYPNSPDDFNILYLVSGRPPAGAMILARAAKWSGARFVLNQNGVAYPAWHGPGWERTNAPMATLHRLADHIFYQSEFCKLSAERYLGRVASSTEVLANPVDTGLFAPTAASPDGLVLLTAGTQHVRYRVDVALRVLREVQRERPDAALVIAGRLWWRADEAAALAEAHALAAHHEVADSVRFVGPYRQADAPALFQSAHVLVHPQEMDAAPTTVLEAMACGLPIVYSSSGGTAEYVGDEAGVAVPSASDWQRIVPADPEAMAAGVLTVASRRSAFSAAARERSLRFDSRAWLQRHVDVFERL